MKGQRMQKHFLWRGFLLLVGSILFFLLLIWVPLSVQASNTPFFLHKSLHSSIQGTPTVDPTITALQKENLEHVNDWRWNFGGTIISSLALLAGVIVTVFKLFGDKQDEREKRKEEQNRWLEDRQAEREKRTEEHFQSAVEGLGSTIQATQVGAAITLRTFLRPGYEQFYNQIFDLAVAHLRLRSFVENTIQPLDSLSQALINIFIESYLLVRNQHIQNMQQLDAARIQLENAYLAGADLEQAWMPQTYLRQAKLNRAKLSDANFSGANLSGADLT